MINLMVKPKIICLFWLLGFLILPGTGQSSANSADELNRILNGIEKRYSGKDFSANFFQQSTLKAIDISENATGKVFFSHPGKMRWEYRTPEQHQIITNGSTLWIYRPGEKQVVQGNALEFFKAGAGGAFLSDIARIREGYDITIEKTDAQAVRLLLIPKKKTPDIDAIKLVVSTKSHAVETVVTSNIYGDTTKLQFSNSRFEPLGESLFEFDIPVDCDLLYMDQ